MKKKTTTIFLIIMLCLVLVGCKKKNTIVGKWSNGSFTYTFNEDNTCNYNAAGTNMKCTYKVDGEKLSIKYVGDTQSFDTTYSIDKDKLNIKDSMGRDTIYTRQK